MTPRNLESGIRQGGSADLEQRVQAGSLQARCASNVAAGGGAAGGWSPLTRFPKGWGYK